ncbi:hypothetical protein H0H93_003544 [Arthromyces matolae]|nr:hypothetical protein H0H93_003544 [Arthromyces matolae]
MRVSVPGLPQAILSAASSTKKISPSEATLRLAEFLGKGSVTVLTGAGVSVDSGIRAYRGNDGRYMNPNYKPIFYHELVDESLKGHSFRQRYWLRSYLGYPPVRDAQPNTTHFAIAALLHTSAISHLITQNVDGLHHKALTQKAGIYWDHERLQETILELHGTLHKRSQGWQRVHCKRGHSVNRETFQEWLSSANPQLKQFADEMERNSQQPRTNPDGDIAVEGLGISYSDYIVPDCPSCALERHKNNIHKPEVIFFGESIPQQIKDRSLLKHALELKKPVMMLNAGPTRADGIQGVVKIDMTSGTIIRDVVRAVLEWRPPGVFRGSTATDNPIVADMLQSGVFKPPPMEHE